MLPDLPLQTLRNLNLDLGKKFPPSGLMGGEQKEEERRVLYDSEDEALSLSDLPVSNCGAREESKSLEGDDFEFVLRGKDSNQTEMCAAEDVFYRGQILPLRLSTSMSSESGTRSESMDRSSSWGFNSSRSSSSRSSDARVVNSFYAHPSPKPQVGLRVRPRNGGGRKSTGWGIFQLGGLAKPTEIELQDLRQRSSRKGGNGGELPKKKTKKEEEMGALKRFSQSGFNCRCSAAAVETVASRIVIIKSRKAIRTEEEEEKGKDKAKEKEEEEEAVAVVESGGKKGLIQRRTFEWLRQLSIAEAPPQG